jgi:hypothetical protein
VKGERVAPLGERASMLIRLALPGWKVSNLP